MGLKTIIILGYSFNGLGLTLGLLSENWLAVTISSIGMALQIASCLFQIISRRYYSSKQVTDGKDRQNIPDA